MTGVLDVQPSGIEIANLGTAAGTSSESDLFLPAVPDLPGSSSIALYVPSTVNLSLSDPGQIIDYVEWGLGGHENEGVAVSASVWSAGAAIAGVAEGHSIEFCGQPGQYGPAYWAEIATPNFGSNGGCVTPALGTSWGRIKSLYR